MEESNDEQKSRRAKSFENNYLLLFASWRDASNVTCVGVITTSGRVQPATALAQRLLPSIRMSLLQKVRISSCNHVGCNPEKAVTDSCL